ncbi:MAG: phosphatidylinositol-specific phospholipase C domain-containing protein [Bacteroidaceae bacterium]|nr:phosphatidylinositol-specific phospholipase C domain-containing protein [Bacteroidaceae bacterium]
MKKINFLAIAAVAVASVFGLSSCDQNDDIDIPETNKPTQMQGNFNPDLEGIWFQTAKGVIDGNENPVAIENSNLWVLDPANGIGAFFSNQKGSEYFELGVYAEADTLTMIEGNFLKKYEESFGKKANYKDIIASEENSQRYGKMSYKLINKDSLIIISESADGMTNYSSYSRLKEAEAQAKNHTRARGSWGSLEDKVVSGITALTNRMEENTKGIIINTRAASQDASDALTISMNELNRSRTEGWTYTDWMSKLSDNTPLSHISIPGTHDACTASVNGAGKVFNADCQSLSIEKQLEAGVRCFDIRTSLDCDAEKYDAVRGQSNMAFFDKNLGTFHGNLSCGISFPEVLRKMKRYLSNHKNETVILRIAFENKNILPLQKYDDKGRVATTRAYHEVMSNKEFVDDIMPYYPTDMLGSVRGKILIMNYNSHGLEDKDRVGSYVTGYDDNKAVTNSVIHKYENKDGAVQETASCVFWEQNYYGMGDLTGGVELKKNSITDFAVNANMQQDIPLFITQLNANSGSLDLDCRSYANKFNSYAFQMLWNNMHSNNAALKGGIYSMDYAGVETYERLFSSTSVYGERLVWAVIENNFHCEK